MGLEGGLGYRPWKGRLRTRALRSWPIAREGIHLVLRRKIFWGFLVLSLMNFTFHSAAIYGTAQIKNLSGPWAFLAKMGGKLQLGGTGEAYRDFIAIQGPMVMVMLALAGWFLLGSDLRAGALPFYLARPLGRLEYFLGKLTAAFCLASLITLVPAVVLFVEYGAFTESTDYYVENIRILGAIVGYGALVSLVPSVILLGLWALLRRMVPMIIAWGALFFLLPGIAQVLRRNWKDRGLPDWGWGLLDFWADLRWISNVLFGMQEEVYGERWPWAALVIAGAMVLAVAAFWKRISAVEVVR